MSLQKSNKTAAAYLYDLGKFIAYLEKVHRLKKVTAITETHIIGFMSQCKAAGHAEATINRSFMSIRAWFRYLRRSKLVVRDMTEDITAPTCKQKALRIPSTEDVKKLLTVPDLDTYAGTRDRAIMELLYSSGLRVSEMCDLNLSDLHANCVLVGCGKGSKTRTVPVTRDAFNCIRDYISRERNQYFKGKSEALFLSMQGKRMTRQLVCKLVIEHARKADLHDITPHTLRHACATHLLEAGADLRMIQLILGHATIASTQRYTHYSAVSIQSMFERYHPREQHE